MAIRGEAEQALEKKPSIVKLLENRVMLKAFVDSVQSHSFTVHAEEGGRVVHATPKTGIILGRTTSAMLPRSQKKWLLNTIELAGRREPRNRCRKHVEMARHAEMKIRTSPGLRPAPPLRYGLAPSYGDAIVACVLRFVASEARCKLLKQ